MTLKLDGKQAIVSEVSAILAQSASVIAAEYSGLTVEELTALRQAARQSGAFVRVVCNALSKRALQDRPFAV